MRELEGPPLSSESCCPSSQAMLPSFCFPQFFTGRSADTRRSRKDLAGDSCTLPPRQHCHRATVFALSPLSPPDLSSTHTARGEQRFKPLHYV